MKVLVTGASGFLGSHVVEALADAGHSVRALVRPTSKTRHLEERGVERAVGAIDAPDTLLAAVEGCDGIVNCAGLTKARNEAEFDLVNAAGPVALLDAALAAGTKLRRFVHVSSLAAAGPSRADTAREENEPCEPLTAYGRSKRRGEEALLARAADAPITVLRPPVIYGPRDAEIFDLFKLARKGRIAPILGDGTTRISMIYGPDCARAARLCLEDESARSGEVYHADDGGMWSYVQMADAFRDAFGVRIFSPRIPIRLFAAAAAVSETWGKITGKAMIFNRDKVKDAKCSYVCGHAKIARELGWSPAVALPEGVRMTAAWYQENGWL